MGRVSPRPACRSDVNDQEKHSNNKILDAFAECRDGLIRNLLKLYVRPEDVDDILQSTFLKTLEADRAGGVASPKDYLFVVSRNLVFKSMSSRSKEMHAVIDTAIAEAHEPTADLAIHYKKKLRAFDDALRNLPEPVRQAIILRKFFGLPYKEIAKKMNVSVSSVEKYVAQGLLRCKDVLRAKGYYADKPDEQIRIKGDAAYLQSSESDR